jgi:hypothetical protein
VQTEYRPCRIPYPGGGFQNCRWGFFGRWGGDGRWIFLSYLAGADGETRPSKIFVDSAGAIYIAGVSSGDFPVTAGAFQAAKDGPGGAAFFAKIDPGGSRILFATYLGNAHPVGLAVDSQGSVFVSMSLAREGMPLRRPLPGMAASIETGYVAKLAPDGSDLVLGTYIGGPGVRSGAGALTTDRDGNLYVTGGCFSETSRRGKGRACRLRPAPSSAV